MNFNATELNIYLKLAEHEEKMNKLQSEIDNICNKNELPNEHEIKLLSEIELLKIEYEDLQEVNSELLNEITIMENNNNKLTEYIHSLEEKIIKYLNSSLNEKRIYYLILERVKDNDPASDNIDYNVINIENITCFDLSDNKIKEVSIDSSSPCGSPLFSPENVLNDSDSIFHTEPTSTKHFIKLKLNCLPISCITIKNRRICGNRLVGCRVRLTNESNVNLYKSEVFNEDLINKSNDIKLQIPMYYQYNHLFTEGFDS